MGPRAGQMAQKAQNAYTMAKMAGRMAYWPDLVSLQAECVSPSLTSHF